MVGLTTHRLKEGGRGGGTEITASILLPPPPPPPPKPHSLNEVFAAVINYEYLLAENHVTLFKQHDWLMWSGSINRVGKPTTDVTGLPTSGPDKLDPKEDSSSGRKTHRPRRQTP